MEFVLLLTISFIPAAIAVSMPFFSKLPMTRALSAFLVLLSMWQLSIALLHAEEVLSMAVIDPLFRLFRGGSIFMIPLLYIFGYLMVKRFEKLQSYRWFYNPPGLLFIISYSLFLYSVNFIPLGIEAFRVTAGRSIWHPDHLMPVYGEWHFLFLGQTVLGLITLVLLMKTTLTLRDPAYKAFYTKFVFAGVFMYANAMLSGFAILPVYFISFNSIVISMLLFLGYFQMQSRQSGAMNRELMRQSRLLEMMMDMSPNYLVVLNGKRRVERVNDSFSLLFGLQKSFLAGQTFDELLQRTGIDPEQEMQRIQRVRYIQWGFREVEVPGEDERFTLFYGVDFTTQKLHEELMIGSEKMKVVGELAASIAHEIRNPMTTIRGFIQLMHEKNHSPHEQLILEEIDRIDDVMQELLLLARPEAKAVKNGSDHLIVNIEQEIRNVLMLFEPVVAEKGHRLEISGALPFAAVHMQSAHFKQVLINMVKNSLEAMEGPGQIRVKLDRSADSVRIRVIDSGKGISPERLARIGEPYYTNKEKGTGIGLTICLKLIRDYRGTMTVKSKVGWGTVMTIRLPAEESARPMEKLS